MISGQGTKSEDEIFDEAYQALLDLADEMNDQASKEKMFRKRLISGCTPEMYSGYQARNPERKRFTLFYTTQLLHTFIPRS